MEKQKRWQFYVIIAVILCTFYNILPTLFYYIQPLHAPIDAKRAESIAKGAAVRVKDLETESIAWIHSFSKLLGVKPISVQVNPQDSRLIEVDFKTPSETALFSKFLPRAGEFIPFVPAQLQLFHTENKGTQVTVLRRVGNQVDPKQTSFFFQFFPKYETSGTLSNGYLKIIEDRAQEMALGLQESQQAEQTFFFTLEEGITDENQEIALALAFEIAEIGNVFGIDSPIIGRYLTSLGALNPQLKEPLQKAVSRFEEVKSRLAKESATLSKEKKEGSLDGLKAKQNALEIAINVIKKQLPSLKNSVARSSKQQNLHILSKGEKELSLQESHPLVKSLLIDTQGNKIVFVLFDDVNQILNEKEKTEKISLKKEKLSQWLIDAVAQVSRMSGESILPDGETFSVKFDQLPDTKGVLTFNLNLLAEKQLDQAINQLQIGWNPTHQDLKREAYPLLKLEDFKKLDKKEQKLALLAYIPTLENGENLKGLKPGSLYFIAKGLNTLIQKAEQTKDTPSSQQFIEEVSQLAKLLYFSGFVAYPGSSLKFNPEFEKDYIFEFDDFYSMWLKATREDFLVKGSKAYAILELSDVEQRILTENKIDDQIQEDLLKWEEEYLSAQADLNPSSRYLIPEPTKNPYLENFKLSFVKFFRGDDRKILKWGLDLSGGKTVRIGLVDASGQPVTHPDDLKQAVNELYERINKLGVAERTIKIENKTIVLDFPGSQGLSAQELVKASAMYFHIVNEKFSQNNPELKTAVNTFLQNVWNEAVVTNRKDVDSINEIAWRHLGGDVGEFSDEFYPKTDVAKALYAQGLRLSNPKKQHVSAEFNDTISKIGRLSGEDFSQWDGQAHPLLILFNNYALEGASLNQIRVGYDPMQGNILSFGVKGSFSSSSERGGSPRDDFYAWTSQFAEEKIQGTPKEAYTQGRGWRMAVVLNGLIVNKPSLKAALRDGATISGRFSQREINQLAADLKAGSLTFTPKILSEENVSPELGKEERTKGFVASFVALMAVVAIMVFVYGFAGVVASLAVFFNILVMWGVLQNLDAALTLPGIAGIVLTIGMAVDANVLVFERIREEFAISKRIASAIEIGYRKAFSAIVDSNITTIIAALVLIQFDSGPIKGFAVTLIIGILSSMFTALFMTKAYFAYWVQNPKNKSLSMRTLFGQTKVNFLAMTKPALIVSGLIMLIGSFVFIQERQTLFGMDFTGGYSLQVNLEEKEGNPSYRLLAKEAFLAAGASSNDVQIRELSRPNQLRIQFGMGMEEKGHPFYQMASSVASEKGAEDYEKNPRIVWVIQALNAQGLTINGSEAKLLEGNWTVMSGQFSDAMRYQATVGLAVALLCILLYITFRFEWKYALGAVVALTHDLVITLGILALFHKFGLSVQIDLQVVGALMTIIGYSLNDTIIIFDRIREDVILMRKSTFQDVINHALNVTLNRTLMTSGTTLAVLISLVLLGGKTLLSFSLVMTIGVLVGTLSSLFIAAPAMLFFHRRELKYKEQTT